MSVPNRLSCLRLDDGCCCAEIVVVLMLLKFSRENVDALRNCCCGNKENIHRKTDNGNHPGTMNIAGLVVVSVNFGESYLLHINKYEEVMISDRKESSNLHHNVAEKAEKKVCSVFLLSFRLVFEWGILLLDYPYYFFFFVFLRRFCSDIFFYFLPVLLRFEVSLNF